MSNILNLDQFDNYTRKKIEKAVEEYEDLRQKLTRDIAALAGDDDACPKPEVYDKLADDITRSGAYRHNIRKLYQVLDIIAQLKKDNLKYNG